MSPEMTLTLQRTVKAMLCISSILEFWAGAYLTYDQCPDRIGSFSGIVVIVIAILIFYGSLTDSLALLALLQVILATLEMVLFILIVFSVSSGFNDQLLMGLYISSLMFLVLQSILLREFLSLKFIPTPEREGYQDLDDSLA